LRIFACLVLLTYGVGATAGAFAVCTEPCGGSFENCTALCLDCACCPSGVSTPFEVALATAGFGPGMTAFASATACHLSAPRAEILHVPKGLLA
jgi:hypothetical protein